MDIYIYSTKWIKNKISENKNYIYKCAVQE